MTGVPPQAGSGHSVSDPSPDGLGHTASVPNALLGRCGNCMEPHRAHLPRMTAPPICRSGKGIYREATEAELGAAYRAEFPDGPKPIATFRADSPADMERAKALLSPEALNNFFGEGGRGMAAWMDAVEASGAETTETPNDREDSRHD